MKIVTPSLVIKDKEGFKQDILNRKGFGQSLLNLVERSNDELVISLDGQWGEGKSTFVKMWQGLLDESDIPNVYIDAFATDYIDDAFISIASSITTYIDENQPESTNEKITEYKEKAKSVGVQLLSWGTKIGVKAATLGVIKDSDIDELKDIKADLAKGASSLVGDFVEERLTSHKKDIELLQSFKTILSEIPNELTNNKEKPLVIIIDELDRCKPTYAVEIIEKVKHLFSVKNVVFVLVMHRRQLEEAVKNVYGQNIDAHTYLQKFINIETSLPKVTDSEHSNDTNKYCHQLYKLHEMETWGDERNLIDCVKVLATHFNLSLRQLEKVFTNLAVFYAASSPNSLRLVPMLSFLSVIKVVEPKLYLDLGQNRISFSELSSTISSSNDDSENTNNRKLQFIMEWFKFALMSEKELSEIDSNERIHNFGSSIWQYHIERHELIKYLSDQLNLFHAV